MSIIYICTKFNHQGGATVAKKNDLYIIKITNWTKHNPNMKSMFKYTKIRNNFCTDGKLSVVPLTHRWLFLALLLEAGNGNSEVLEMSERQLRAYLETSKSVDRVLASLQSLQLLTYQKNTPLIREEKRREEKIKEKKGRVISKKSEPEIKTDLVQNELLVFEEPLASKMPPAENLLKIWNDFSSSLPKAKGLSKNRAKSAEVLWRHESNEAYWIEVVKKITASNFCTGDNERGWIATFDWFLKPDTHLKVMEGKFDTRTKSGMYMTHGMKIAHNSQVMSKELRKMMAAEEEEDSEQKLKDAGSSC